MLSLQIFDFLFFVCFFLFVCFFNICQWATVIFCIMWSFMTEVGGQEDINKSSSSYFWLFWAEKVKMKCYGYFITCMIIFGQIRKCTIDSQSEKCLTPLFQDPSNVHPTCSAASFTWLHLSCWEVSRLYSTTKNCILHDTSVGSSVLLGVKVCSMLS